MNQRDRLIELLKTPHKAEKLRDLGIEISRYESDTPEAMIADFLLAQGVMIPRIEKGTILVVYRPNGNNMALVATEKNVLRLLTTDEIKRESNAKTAIWGKFKPKTVDEYYPEIMRHFTEVE